MSTFTSFNPRTGAAGQVKFEDAGPAEVEAAARAASRAYETLRLYKPAALADALREIAQELEASVEELVEVADRETGLGRPRLIGELARTTGQFRLFAELCREGSFVDAAIDAARPDASPPQPDLRRMLVPLGPVAVFGASNFPFAFSVPGGDTASALAAGCPVVVKAHPSHPETSQLCAEAIQRALQRSGAPQGTFGVVHGTSNEVGQALVTAADIRAVGFTGSLRGGRALYDLAAKRPDPIPVYAEMGSVNPVFVTARALSARLESIAHGFAASMTQGAGQFCTKPGLAFVPDGDLGRRWAATVASRLAEDPVHCLLNAGIRDALRAQVGELLTTPGVDLLTDGAVAGGPAFSFAATLLGVDAETFMETPRLSLEHFGPVGVVVRYGSSEQLVAMARRLHGNLTATVHAEPDDLHDVASLMTELREKAGRLIWNAFPTGVAVTHAMIHGGPYPASTASLHTSVGSAAIRRWLRPVAYQSYPPDLLPPALADENPLGIMRLVNGCWSREAL